MKLHVLEQRSLLFHYLDKGLRLGPRISKDHLRVLVLIDTNSHEITHAVLRNLVGRVFGGRGGCFNPVFIRSRCGEDITSTNERYRKFVSGSRLLRSRHLQLAPVDRKALAVVIDLQIFYTTTFIGKANIEISLTQILPGNESY